MVDDEQNVGTGKSLRDVRKPDKRLIFASTNLKGHTFCGPTGKPTSTPTHICQNPAETAVFSVPLSNFLFLLEKN